MTNTSWLPKFLRWVFGAFTVLMGIAAVTLIAVLLIDPQLPADAQFGPVEIQAMGHPGTFTIRHSNFDARLLNGGLNVRVDNARGLVETLKHYALPLALLYVLFFMLQFDLLRKLFRNVGRSESFTQQNVRLVQFIGFSLLLFSRASDFADGWFHHEVYGYISQHATFMISGTPIRLPQADAFTFGQVDGSPFGSSYFWTGLLVLALSEVFRQGLVLKRENDLTV